MSVVLELLNLLQEGSGGKRAAAPSVVEGLSGMMEMVVSRLLMAVAVLFLAIGLWRLLDFMGGPIVAPLGMAAVLALSSALVALREKKQAAKRRARAATGDGVSKLGTTLVGLMFAPKIVRWISIAALLYDVWGAGKGKGAPQGARRRA